MKKSVVRREVVAVVDACKVVEEGMGDERGGVDAVHEDVEGSEDG